MNLQKKKILFFSTCHGSIIRQIMFNNPAFVEKYESFYIANFAFRMKSATPADMNAYAKNLYENIKTSDIIIYQKVNKNHGKWSTDELFKNIKPGCRLILLPNFYNTAFFPLCKLGDYYGSKLFGEETIRDCLSKNKTLDGIILEYKENKLDWHFQERFDDNILRYKNDEEKSDVKIVDFILKYYKDYRLFADELHPSSVLCTYIANQLFDLLQIDGIRFNPFDYKDIDLYFHAYSTPAKLFYDFKWMPNKINDDHYIEIITELYNKWHQNPLSVIDTEIKEKTSYTF